MLRTRRTVPPVIIFAIVAVPACIVSTQNSYYFGSSHIFSEGTTVDYAIYLTGRYRENRSERRLDRKQAVRATVAECIPSIITSGSVMTLVGLALGAVSTHGVLKEIGHYLGVGTILSVIMVLIVLPGLLYLFDAVVMGRKNKTGQYKKTGKISEGKIP